MVVDRKLFLVVAILLNFLSSSCQFNFDTDGNNERDAGDNNPIIDPDFSNIFGEGGTSSTPAKITILLRSVNGHPIKGVTPTFRAFPTSPHDKDFTCGSTNIDGEADCSFSTYDAGIKKNLYITSPISKAGDSVTFTRTVTAFEEILAASEAGTKSMENFEIQPVIALKDPLGIIVENSDTNIRVKLKTISSDTAGIPVLFKNGKPCSLSGCTVTPVDGRVDFSLESNRLSVDHSGTFSLLYSAENATTLESTPFAINNGVAAKIEFAQQPSQKVSTAEPFPQQPIIAIRDAEGNLITKEPGDGSLSALVTMDLSLSSPGNDTLTGSRQQYFTKGVADFSGNGLKVKLNDSSEGGPGYSLNAVVDFGDNDTANDLTTFSRSFIVTRAGEANTISFSTQPSNTVTTGVILSQQPVLQILDINGDLATNDSETAVTIRLTGSQTDDGGTDSPGLLPDDFIAERTARNGMIAFSGLKIENPYDSTTTQNPGNYQLEATVTGPSVSPILEQKVASINIRVEQTGIVSTKLAWQVRPGPTGRNQPIKSVDGTSLKVVVQDGAGNIVERDNTTIINITKEFGQGELTGITTKTVVDGVATFDDLKLDALGPHTLKANTIGLEPALSGSFYINTNGTPSKLKFITSKTVDGVTSPIGPPRVGQTPRGESGVSFPRETIVEVQDESGNLIETENGSIVTLSCSEPVDCILKGSTEAVVIDGRAIFSANSLFIENTVGNNIQLIAISSLNYQEDALPGVAIDAGPIDNYHSSIAAEPPSRATVNDGVVTVVVKDQFGNPHISETVTLCFDPSTTTMCSNSSSCSGSCSTTNSNGISLCSFKCTTAGSAVVIGLTAPSEITQTAVVGIPAADSN